MNESIEVPQTVVVSVSISVEGVIAQRVEYEVAKHLPPNKDGRAFQVKRTLFGEGSFIYFHYDAEGNYTEWSLE